MNALRIEMDHGETRHVKILILSLKNEDFTIESANYELINEFEIKPESVGEVAIDGHVLDAVITPKKKNIYTLRFIYKIADETLVDIVKVKVR